jgi:hypothetical protein
LDALMAALSQRDITNIVTHELSLSFAIVGSLLSLES